MFSGARLTIGAARPAAGAVFAAAAISILVQAPPYDAVVWLAAAFPLAAASFAIWRLDVPASYAGMDIASLRVHVWGHAAILAVCGVVAYVCVALLPPEHALAVAAGFTCAAALAAVRLWLVADARRRFTVWRR